MSDHKCQHAGPAGVEMNVLKNTPLSPGPGQRPDEVAIMEAYRAIDRTREALSARMTGGLSPTALALALFDWSLHLASAPGKRLELLDKAVRKSLDRTRAV